LLLHGSSSGIVSDDCSGGIDEGKGLGVNMSLEVGMRLESSSIQRVDSHLGDQYLH